MLVVSLAEESSARRRWPQAPLLSTTPPFGRLSNDETNRHRRGLAYLVARRLSCVHSFLLATLLGAAFLLGCQEASGPAGPYSEIIGPAFDHNENAKPGHGGGDGTEDSGGKVFLFISPNFTCALGAGANRSAMSAGGRSSWETLPTGTTTSITSLS